MNLFLFVKRGAFFLRELDPISTSASPLDPLFQRFPQLLGAHGQERFQGILASLHFFFLCENPAYICS
jgi:hypothetical protein